MSAVRLTWTPVLPQDRPVKGASRFRFRCRASAPGGTAARRDGRSGGAQGQSPRRDGRSGGAHARRSRGPAGAQGAPAGAQGAPAGGQDAPIPAGFGQRRPQRLQYTAPSVDGGTHVETTVGPGMNDDFARVGRNDPCPCGSGRKYKRCHGDPRNRPDL